MEWQPIETAPKKPLDKNNYGPEVLLFTSCGCMRGFWDHDFGKFYIEGDDHHNQPTHWMPLPEPPR